MTIEITQEDEVAASALYYLCADGADKGDMDEAFARHRIAAYEKGQRDAVERLTGLGGGL